MASPASRTKKRVRSPQAASKSINANVPGQPVFSKRPVLSLFAFLFALQLVTYVMLPVKFPGDNLEESWKAFLGWAFQHKRQFGTEVIFTYGPWGFLWEPRGDSSLYPWQVIGRLFLAVSASLGTAYLAISWIRRSVLRWVWSAILILIAQPPSLVPMLLFLATGPSEPEDRWKHRVVILLAVATGLAA